MATEAQCKRALDLFGDKLSGHKHVVGLGIVPADETAPSGRRACAVAVYVKKKVPLARLTREDRVPQTLELPGRDGTVRVPTRVIEQGEVRLESAETETA